MKTLKTDVLVIGAGPSGTVAASIIQKAGLDVCIVEREQFPRFVIGESLIPKCMEHFEAAGFLPTLKEQGFQEKHGAVFIRGNDSCEFKFTEQFTKGWTWTWQVQRAKFDKALADNLESRGVPIHYKHSVTDVQFDGSDSVTTLVDHAGNKSQIAAKFVIDASGYGRVLPRLLDLGKASNFPVRKAIFTHIKDPDRPAGIAGSRITFIVYNDDFWLWIIPFSDGTTSLGFVGDPKLFDEYKGSIEERFTTMLAGDAKTPPWIQNPTYIFPPKEIMGYSSAVKQLYGPGYALTGNAAEFLDPIFSSGVTFGTESGLLAAKLAAKQLKGETVDWEVEYADHIKRGVDTFRTYVKSWYDSSLQDIFFAKNVNREYKRRICSVLAGYVWDEENSFVKKHKRAVKALSGVARLEKKR